VVVSQNETKAQQFLAKVRLAYDNLPSWARVPLSGGDSKSFMTFADFSSEIRALPSTPTSALGMTASLVIHDEADFHPYAEQTAAHSMPAIDAGAKFIVVSTANKDMPDTYFKREYKRAKLGQNNMFPIFLP